MKNFLKTLWHELLANYHGRRAEDLLFEAHYTRDPSYMVSYHLEMDKADKHRSKALYGKLI